MFHLKAEYIRVKRQSRSLIIHHDAFDIHFHGRAPKIFRVVDRSDIDLILAENQTLDLFRFIHFSFNKHKNFH